MIGSQWGIWDLHIHTPCSIVQEYGGDTDQAWEKFINALEALPETFKVLGINDYLFLDGYKKLKASQKEGRLSGRVLFPVVEFRSDTFTGSDGSLSKINLHIIFSPELDAEDIEINFLQQLNLSNGSALTKINLEQYGTVEKAKLPPDIPCNTSDLKYGFQNFEVNKDQILGKLSSIEGWTDKYLTAIGIVEWGEIRWTKAPSKKREHVEDTDFMFCASPTIDLVHKHNKYLEDNYLDSRLLHCSDSHQINKTSDGPKSLGHCFTWIKSQPTLEGLRQTLFSYDTRVHFGDSAPTTPLHTIPEMTIDLPDSMKYSSNGKEEKFCLSGVNTDISFHSGLTCFIGGRGSGKSTILELIANKIIGFSENNFTHLKNVINFDSQSHISFKNDDVTINPIYIGQSEIADLATDQKKLTHLILDNIQKKQHS